MQTATKDDLGTDIFYGKHCNQMLSINITCPKSDLKSKQKSHLSAEWKSKHCRVPKKAS